MKILIELSEQDYKLACDFPNTLYGAYAQAISNGTPVKTGHWILQPSNKEQGERDFIWWKCSECGQVIYSETEKDRREYHAFCGRCGKRMIESQESER